MRIGGAGRIGQRYDAKYGGAAAYVGVVRLVGTSVGEGLAAASLSTLEPSLVGASVGEGLAAAALQTLEPFLAGVSLGEGTASGRVQNVVGLAGASLGEGLAFGALTPIFVLAGTSLGEGTAYAFLSGTVPIAGTSLGEGLAVARLSTLTNLAGTSLGEGTAYGLLELARLVASDAIFYLDFSRGMIPTIGGRPVFSRATSAPSTDPQDRPIVALPNTPRFPFATLDGFRRAVLQLEAAKAGPPVQAVDRAWWGTSQGVEPLGLYVRLVCDFNAALGGSLAWLATEEGTPPFFALYHSGQTARLALHNGVAGNEAFVGGFNPAPGTVVELLGLATPAGLELVVATGGAILGMAAAALPAGGLPAAWSSGALVLNGGLSSPSNARYAEVKILRAPGFVRAGAGRLEEARTFRLDPVGRLIA